MDRKNDFVRRKSLFYLSGGQNGKMEKRRAKSTRSVLNFHHFKIFLAAAAIGTSPIHRHIFPKRAGRNAVFGAALRFVVDKGAN